MKKSLQREFDDRRKRAFSAIAGNKSLQREFDDRRQQRAFSATDDRRQQSLQRKCGNRQETRAFSLIVWLLVD